MTIENPWYSIVNGENLQQGDFIDKCPAFIPEYNFRSAYLAQNDKMAEYEISGYWQEYDVVIMNQSCDLQHGKLKFVLVCPHWSLEELGEQNQEFKNRKTREEIRRGYRPGYHMLNACTLDEKQHGIRVVEFGSVFSIPFDFLTHFAGTQGKRVRLLPPYREQLSQAFGKFFMRVGLPNDIPSF